MPCGAWYALCAVQGLPGGLWYDSLSALWCVVCIAVVQGLLGGLVHSRSADVWCMVCMYLLYKDCRVVCGTIVCCPVVRGMYCVLYKDC